MEQLFNGFTLELSDHAFPLTTDSIALAEFVKLGRNARVLDLGSGCGTLGLLLCSANENCHVTGIEIDEQAHAMALHNIACNNVQHRLTSICADIRSVSQFIDAGSFSCCISNPPYFSAGPQSHTVPNARREDLCSLEDLICSAAWALKYGGDLFLVHRPERMAELIACGAKYGLEAKRLRLLRHNCDGPISLILIQLRKGAKPGLVWEEEFLHNADGRPSAYYRKLYHLKED